MDVRILDNINSHYLCNEEQAVAKLSAKVEPASAISNQNTIYARQWVIAVRSQPERISPST
jgi:hypothetical protein